jgi:hypothetical protein
VLNRPGPHGPPLVFKTPESAGGTTRRPTLLCQQTAGRPLRWSGFRYWRGLRSPPVFVTRRGLRLASGFVTRHGLQSLISSWSAWLPHSDPRWNQSTFPVPTLGAEVCAAPLFSLLSLASIDRRIIDPVAQSFRVTSSTTTVVAASAVMCSASRGIFLRIVE